MSGGEAAAEDKGEPVGGEFQAAVGVAGKRVPAASAVPLGYLGAKRSSSGRR